jgi:peptidyl-prolyl cis-trans isomerase-like protein 2
MGRNKNRNSKNKLYLTVSEQQELAGSKSKSKEKFERLPFYCCSLSLLPFTDPVCTEDGTIYDILHIYPYVMKHKKDPVSNKPLHLKDLIRLSFSKNPEGQYHCPITYKVFTEHSSIVAIKTTGNVFSSEAVDELCKKPKHFKDLLTDEPFSLNDIIILQDPAHPKDSSKFFFVQNKEKPVTSLQPETPSEDLQHERFTTGMTAASFTSTSLTPQTTNNLRGLSEAEIRKLVYQEVASSSAEGEAVLITTQGRLRIRLFCNLTQMTCENFLTLSEEGYYNGVIFHRNIPGFMIQGGDPTGTGSGGKNIFSPSYFRDEFCETLTHHKRGMVSMANSGPNTNKSQFFITYKAAPYLDNKHTVFGEVLGDTSALDIMELVPTDLNDRPVKVEVKVIDVEVVLNPFREAKVKILQKLQTKNLNLDEDWLEIPKSINVPAVKVKGIGKYIDRSKKNKEPSGMYADYQGKRRKSTGFDFNNWE